MFCLNYFRVIGIFCINVVNFFFSITGTIIFIIIVII